MKIFISWSGADSRKVAEALRTWLPKVLLQKVTPFVSSRDIEKGARGMDVIAANLEGTGFGLVVLTKANQDAKWINFEAGALGKDLGSSSVAPLLLDLTQADVEGPLTQFQMTGLRDRDDVWALIKTINKALVDEAMPEDGLSILFDSLWPELEALVESVASSQEPPTTSRPPEAILDEILYRVRRIERQRQTKPDGFGVGVRREIAEGLFRAISGSDEPTKYSFKESAHGPTVRVTAGSDAVLDYDLLQRIADRYSSQIEVEPHGHTFVPRGRFRDPAHVFVDRSPVARKVPFDFDVDVEADSAGRDEPLPSNEV